MEIVNQIVMKKISEVKPYVRNPRKNDKTVNLLVEIIPKVGFNVPLVIDRNGIIVKGHARYAAAIRLGMEEVPCVVTDADEETIKLDRLADNRISEFSEWINDELLHEIDMLNLDFDFDLESLGFPAPSDDFDADALFDDGVVGESEEDAAKLVPGTKIRVTGYKSEWSGEVEITDGTFEFVKGDSYIAEPLDVTDLLGTDELIDHQNEFVSFTGLTVAPSTDANGNEAAFLYNWDGSGEKGNDLYFNVTVNGQTYNFCVESYLCGQDTEVYQAVEALQIGDVINAEGFLYWYEGVNPHITSVSAAN